MIRPNNLAIHVTYTCPLACAHCCFNSSPASRERLSREQILGAIEALKAGELELVAFTGGEPLLLGADLVAAVARAHARGFRTRIISSAYFGRSEEGARFRLAPLREAGLDEMTISWDDFHEAFVPFGYIANVFRVARELGIQVGINMVQSSDSRWTARRAREELGLPPDAGEVAETSLNRTGRAVTDLASAGFPDRRFLGPCPYVLTGPTLSATGKLLACCGVIPDTAALTLDPEFRPESLNAAIERGLRSPLLNWLFLRGPYALMEQISARSGVAIPAREALGGNCEACKRLFETPEVARHIDEVLRLKAAEIEGELSVLAALGWLTPEKVERLWLQRSLLPDGTPASPDRP